MKKLIIILVLLGIIFSTYASNFTNDVLTDLDYYTINDYIRVYEFKSESSEIDFQYNITTNEIRVVYVESSHIDYDEGRIRDKVHKLMISWMNSNDHKYYHYKIVRYTVKFNRIVNDEDYNIITIDCVLSK